MKRYLLALLVVTILWVTLPAGMAAQTDDGAVVQAVLFYSPTCPHCHDVIENVLPPLVDRYGDRLQILGVDTSRQTGQQLYLNMLDAFDVADSRRGVPALLVGETLLVGSLEIPQQFPGIIEAGLAEGGIVWPEVPGLREVYPDLPAGPQTEGSPAAAETTGADGGGVDVPAGTVDADPAVEQLPPEDPAGFAVAWVVLAGMVAALGVVGWRFAAARPGLWPPERANLPAVETGAVMVLVILGLGVAAYLAYVEITQVEAVCGPVGECNIVQSSPYATLLGVPVAVLGVLNYLAVAVLWVVNRRAPGRGRHWAVLGMLALTVLGTLFSIYLTLLELFAIHAVCAWCLSSAVLTTMLMLVVTLTISEQGEPARPGAQPQAGRAV